MLQLKRRDEPGRPSRERPLDLLEACHERIRRFSAFATWLSDPAGAGLREISDAAAQVHRFFSIALPLHVADEERSLRRALLEVSPNGPVAEALETMAREHSELELLLADLIPCWAALGEEPRLVGELAMRLDAAKRLDRLFREHLELEETAIFPAVAALPEAVAESILVEMRGRRAPSGGASTADSHDPGARPRP